tara:strand:+ start:8024 stop:8500 length:477 start_codon:yes stop_codon:yes gene_type:complete
MSGEVGKPKIETGKLKRTEKDKVDDTVVEKEPKVSAGAVEKVIDLAFNPTRDKIREVTIIDRVQARLFPQLDMVNYMRGYCIEIAMFRRDPEAYEKEYKKPRPVPPAPLDEFMFRTAQWQKSVAGKNLERATDIALAETETRGQEEEDIRDGASPWND